MEHKDVVAKLIELRDRTRKADIKFVDGKITMIMNRNNSVSRVSANELWLKIKPILDKHIAKVNETEIVNAASKDHDPDIAIYDYSPSDWDCPILPGWTHTIRLWIAAFHDVVKCIERFNQSNQQYYDEYRALVIEAFKPLDGKGLERLEKLCQIPPEKRDARLKKRLLASLKKI